MKKILFFIIVSIFLINRSAAQQNNTPDTVIWLTIEEALEKCETSPRPIFIDVYADWCAPCKQLAATTLKEKQVVDYLNYRYYPVRFNAESPDTVTYQGKTYINRRLGTKNPVHDLAIELLDGNLTYPSLVFIDKQKNKQVVPGFIEGVELIPILVYFNEDIHQSTPFDTFKKYFRKTYPRESKTGYSMVRSIVKWIPFEEAMEKMKTNPKKIFLDISVDWNIGSTMMTMSTYNNPRIGQYLNEKYYPVRLNATSKDTLHVFQDTFYNAENGHPYHQLAVALLQAKMKFPSTLIFNEEAKLINTMQVYLAPEDIEPILMYFGEDAYKNTSWKDYRANFKSNYFTAEYFFNSGEKNTEAGKYEIAMSDYSKAVGLKPDYAEAYYKMGLLKIYQFKKQDEGCKDITKAMELGYDKVTDEVKKLCQ